MIDYITNLVRDIGSAWCGAGF